MRLAERLSKIPPYLFMELREKIGRARRSGVDVISLAIGDPVEPTPSYVIEELCKEAHNAENHRYPTDEEKGMLSFRREVAAWYQRKYGVALDPETEVLALIGSKEGCHHFAMAVVNPGDTVLMTDPGYPAYRASIWLANGEPVSVPVLAANEFLPKFEDIPSDVARRAVAMFLNYPNNPTGAVATPDFFRDLVAFAKTYDIAICHDNPYSEIVFDGCRPLSFLQTPGARDVGVELNSLSKPYNMTGWRIGMAVGNSALVSGLAKVKENTDSGIFNAIQHAGIRALRDGQENIDRMLAIYEWRRRRVLETLWALGWERYRPSPGTFYLWIPTPNGMSSIEFATLLFERANVVVAAGSAYGRHGEGYFRVSLTVPDDRLDEAMERFAKAVG
jgi:LL-diaminopimelate aminotransferase